MTRISALIVAATLLASAAAVAESQPASAPDAANGRYAFTPTVDGVLRLDTRTGRLASCHNRISGWACYTLPDERAALDGEIGRLQSENSQLKQQLTQMRSEQQRFGEELASLKASYAKLAAERDTAQAAAAPPDSAETKKNRIELQLPDEKDMERVTRFIERTWRNLMAMADRVQKDVGGKI